ncbi:MAG: membrane protein insertion efficiency factor YidD [Neisseria sp.]|nr:membrane protein insertion efficiency factor YidD [Neisseria sp.]
MKTGFEISSLPARLVLLLIRGYQRYVSPRKGYGCPYRLYYGGSGCSGAGYRLIRRYGLFKGWLCLNRRFDHCSHAAALLRKQRGECVDLDVCDLAECACDIFECRRDGRETGRPPKKKARR